MVAGAKSKLLVIAGYHAAGKSTLLRHCLTKGINPFTSSERRDFLKFKVPSTHSEWIIPTDEILKNNYWFSEIHIPFLRAETLSGRNTLVHVDLLRLVTDLQLVSNRRLSAEYPRTFERLLDMEENKLIMRNVLNDQFRMRWDQIVIKTLMPSYEENCRRFHQRGRNSHLSFLFNGGERARMAHTSILEAWISTVSSWNCVKRHLTEVQNEKMVTLSAAEPRKSLFERD